MDHFQGANPNIQNGDMSDLVFWGIYLQMIGGDGFDFKQRGPSQDTYGVSLSDIFVERACQNVDNTAAIDIRGDACLNNIQSRYNGVPDLDSFAVRFRQYANENTGGDAATGSSLTNFHIMGHGGDVGTPGSAAVTIGSSDCSVSNGNIKGVPVGVRLFGNTFGNSMRSRVSSVTASDCGEAYQISVQDAVFQACHSVNCTVGWRLGSTGANLMACFDHGSATPVVETGSGTTVIGGNLTLPGA